MIIVYKHLRIRGYLQCIHCWAIEMTSETFHPLPWWPKSILDGSKLGVPASSNSSGSALPGMWLKDLRKEPDQSYNTAEVYRKNTCERPWSWWKVWVLRKSSYLQKTVQWPKLPNVTHKVLLFLEFTLTIYVLHSFDCLSSKANNALSCTSNSITTRAMPCPSFPASKSTSAPAFGAPTWFGGHLRRSCCWKSWKLRRRCLRCLHLQGRSSGDALEGRLQRSLRRRPIGRRLLRCQWWSGGHFGGHGWDGDPIRVGVVLWLRDRSELQGKRGQVLGRLKLHRHQRGG